MASHFVYRSSTIENVREGKAFTLEHLFSSLKIEFIEFRYVPISMFLINLKNFKSYTEEFLKDREN